ncbi:MAG: hypothetical protein ACLFTP_05275 [Rhodosalinus sp.]|uniref:hypothetical protein n=1 Tax=Rhodosalinus sp. TaxID=2047741 RepID=UPI00397C596F
MALIETHDRTAIESAGWLLKAIVSLNGGALFGAAVGLWLLPGSNLGADVLVMKAGLTVFLALAGLTLLACVRPRRRR